MSDRLPESGGPFGALDGVATALLHQRPARPPDHSGENEALLALARALAGRSPEIAQRLVEHAMHLCRADSAGVSLLSEDGSSFRWVATAGLLAPHLGGTLPREASPCGEVLRRCDAVLMREPARLYPAVAAIGMPIAEVLLVPFERNGVLIGTVWIVSHASGREFDAEDLRIVRSLAVFASAASATVGLVQELERTAQQASSQLAEAERQRQLLAHWFAQAPGFVAVLRGREHVFEIANHALVELVGQRELVGRGVFEAVPDLRGQGFEAVLEKVFATGQPFVGREVRLALQPGGATPTERYADFVCQPLLDAAGRVDAVFLQGHDVTDRRRAIEAMRQADQNKDAFIAKLSHELRNPLSPLKVAGQVLRRQMPDAEPVQKKMLDVIENQTSALTALVDDLLDMSRIKAGKLVIRPVTVSLQEVLASALELSAPHIDGQGHRLDVSMPDAPLEVEGDPHRLTQVVCNLLNNAAKYTPRGGRIALELRREADEAVLQVSDNGIGIPRAVMPRIFEMYQQAPEADRQSQSGLGIGLALVRQLVELHGGSVTAHSGGADMGSTFTVRLPAART